MKKTLTIILVIALLCIMAVGTTLTYFTDTDFDKNVMTVGKVEIVQNEEFAQNSKLYPYTGTITTGGNLDLGNNALTKTVTVTNDTASETAFIRTLFAFEAVSGNDPVGSVIHVDYNTAVDAEGKAIGTWAKVSEIQIASTTYYVYSFTYAKSYAAGTTTEASLERIALDGKEGNGFSNGNYEILVVSQAVQAQGFANAADAFAAAFPYGENNTNVAGWFTPGT